MSFDPLSYKDKDARPHYFKFNTFNILQAWHYRLDKFEFIIVWSPLINQWQNGKYSLKGFEVLNYINIERVRAIGLHFFDLTKINLTNKSFQKALTNCVKKS